MKNTIATVALTAMIAAGLAACGESSSDEPDYVGMCVHPETEERVDDDACDSDDSDYLTTALWWYMLTSSSRSVPAIGQTYNPDHGTYKVPKGKTYTKGGLPKKGASTPKKAYQKSSKPAGTGGGYKWEQYKPGKPGGDSQKKPGGGGSKPKAPSGRR